METKDLIKRKTQLETDLKHEIGTLIGDFHTDTRLAVNKIHIQLSEDVTDGDDLYWDVDRVSVDISLE